MELVAQTIRELVAQNTAAQTAYEVLSGIGGTVYVVGGAVRDLLLGKEPKDIDMLVTGLPLDQIKDTLNKVGGRATFTGAEQDGEQTGKAFGVILYSAGGDHVEIALPRIEFSSGVGHKDFEVNYDHRIPVEVDLGRRDFTANAIAINLTDGTLVDPYGGAEDISSGHLKMVNPKAFEEDPLRILRAIVAYARHGLMPDADTQKAMKEQADKIRNLPGERIQMELDKLIAAPDPATAFEIAAESGVLDYILPEVSQTIGFDQKSKYHDLELGEHLFTVMRNICQNTDDIDLRLAALLHDIGKPESYWEDEEGYGHYYQNPAIPNSVDHEDLGAEMVKEIMERLAYPKDRIKRVTDLVQNHMFPYFTTLKGARKHLNNLQGDYGMAQDLMKIRDADSRGKHYQIDPRDEEAINLCHKLLEETQNTNAPVTVKALAINGNDLMALGVPQGPQIGQILNSLLEMVLDDPSLNNRDDLLQIAGNIHGT